MQSYSYTRHLSSIVRYLFLDGMEIRPWSRQIEGLEADQLETKNMVAATSQRAQMQKRRQKAFFIQIVFVAKMFSFDALVEVDL